MISLSQKKQNLVKSRFCFFILGSPVCFHNLTVCNPW